MFIEQGIHTENKFWKYIVGSLIIIVASSIGQIPLLLAVIAKSVADGKGIPANQDDIMKVLDSNLTLFLILISFVFAIIGVFVVNKYLHKQSFLTIVSARKKVDWRRILFSFSLWTIITILSTTVMYYSNPGDFEVNFKPIPFLILAVIAILLIPVQTTCEELVFRGYLMQGFANLSLNKWFPLVMTSVIFGSMHIFNPEVSKMGYIILVYYIGTGFFLGILTLMDEGMELSLGFHAANNLIGALLVTTDWTVFQTNSILKDLSEPTTGFDIILPVVVIYPILLIIFSKKYRWKDWKEKLTGKINVQKSNEIEKVYE
jgi:membrane protease YdiL (CAAX protease family)